MRPPLALCLGNLGNLMKVINKTLKKREMIHVGSIICLFQFLLNWLLSPADDFFLNHASPKRLNKLLKKKLLGLYEFIGSTESADSLKKSDIIDAIINARDEAPLAPPSSPGRTDGASSEYVSSDDGNVAGDETDAPVSHQSPNGRHVIRRATIHDMSKLTPRPRNTKGRSVSMGNIIGNGESSSSHVDKGLEKLRYV